MNNNLMVSISGIRGIIGESLNPNIIVSFILSFAKYIGLQGKVVLGRDTRTSGHAIALIIKGTLNLCGINVIDLGIVTTPTVELLVKKFNANAGIIITASHNPDCWNGLKFLSDKGIFLTEKQGQKLIDIFHKKSFNYANYKNQGITEFYNNANIDHIEYILSKLGVKNIEKIKKKKFKVIIDSCNGAGSDITVLLLKKLGCKIIKYNCDIKSGFPRNPEPICANLKDTIEFVKTKKPDVCFIQDPDADRLAIISEKGKYISEEFSLVLSSLYILSKNKGNVVVNLSTSMMIDKIAEKFGVKVFRTKVGEINVIEKMIKVNAVIGGEGNGGVICPEFHYARDSLVGIGLVLSLMAEENKNISELVNEIPNFIMKKHKIEISKEKYLGKKEKIKKIFENCKIDERDGLKFVWNDKWVHIRVSNTEPIVRIIAEAETEEIAQELINKIENVIRKL